MKRLFAKILFTLGVSTGVQANDFETIVSETYNKDILFSIGAGIDVAGDRDIQVHGIREKGQTVEVTPEDRWHIGSISKSVTGLLLGTFMQEGRLDLDETLPNLLPHLAENMHQDWKAVTLRDVLQHRGGFKANFGYSVMTNGFDDGQNLRELRSDALAGILAHPAKSQGYVYSNVGFTLAGHVAETLGNAPWEQLVIERIFTPLGLESAGFGAPKGEERNDQPSGHSNIFGFIQRPMNPHDSPADNTPIIGPAGTIHMSIDDLLTYGRSVLEMRKGSDGVISAETFADLTRLPDGNNTDASGWITSEFEQPSREMIWHNGSNTMWYAFLALIPQSDAIIVVTTNSGAGQSISLIENTVLAIEKSLVSEQTSAD